METFFDQQEFVVIDNGTGFIKAGFSGEDLPRCVLPTVYGTYQIPIDPSQVTGPLDQNIPKTEHYFGTAAFAMRNKAELHFPVQRGIIDDFDSMDKIWEHIFEKELNVETKDIGILVTDSPMNSKENKKNIAKIMFEKFKVGSLAIMNTAVLSLFSTGKTTGVVAECGEGVSYTVPIFEGYALPHAINKNDIAG